MYFQRNGYVRRTNAVRRKSEGHLYKKGAEVRLVAETEAELTDIRDLLVRAGFKVARPFEKAQHWRQPIYGVAAVARFLALVGAAPQTPPPAPSQPAKRRGPGRPSKSVTRIIFDWDDVFSQGSTAGHYKYHHCKQN